MLRRLLHYRPSRNRIAVAILLLPVVVILTFYQTSSPAFILEHPYFQYDLDTLEPRDSDNQRCVLPRIHPFHPSIWRYLVPNKKIVCALRKSDLTLVGEDGWLKFNESELQTSGYEVGKSLQCFWAKVERGGASGNIDDVVSYGKESPVPKDGLLLPPDVEILRVICRNFANFAIYDRLHVRIRDVRTFATPFPGHARNFVNVLIFGVDSLSRLAFIRHLPLTYKYLTEDLKMTVLRGMNKVGDNTYPNLVALLTGKAAYGGYLPNSSLEFDDWPLIWKNYSQAGYATMWAEDYPDFGLFSYLAPGFRQPPTLHYLRPYWLAVKESPLLKISSHMCYGTKPRYLMQLDYVRQFVSVYGSKGIPYFGFSFLAELSHEYMTRISSADIHFREFFQWLADSGQLDNTLLIVMSDHGHRFDAIRTTKDGFAKSSDEYTKHIKDMLRDLIGCPMKKSCARKVGHIEERNPFYSVRIPMTLTSRQPKILANLLSNSGRLVTPFDAYAMLSDLLEFVVTGRPVGISPPPPGILGRSLFGPIPANRTCQDASVPVHYCVCETATPIDSSDRRAKSAALAIVEYVNQLLKEVADKCAKLTVSDVMSAHLVKTMEESEGDGGDGKEQKVRVVFEAQPSMALFEATVIMQGDSVEVWGEVSRINPYAGQSDCIRHAILRKYCFCTDRNSKL